MPLPGPILAVTAATPATRLVPPLNPAAQQAWQVEIDNLTPWPLGVSISGRSYLLAPGVLQLYPSSSGPADVVVTPMPPAVTAGGTGQVLSTWAVGPDSIPGTFPGSSAPVPTIGRVVYGPTVLTGTSGSFLVTGLETTDQSIEIVHITEDALIVTAVVGGSTDITYCPGAPLGSNAPVVCPVDGALDSSVFVVWHNPYPSLGPGRVTVVASSVPVVPSPAPCSVASLVLATAGPGSSQLLAGAAGTVQRVRSLSVGGISNPSTEVLLTPGVVALGGWGGFGAWTANIYGSAEARLDLSDDDGPLVICGAAGGVDALDVFYAAAANVSATVAYQKIVG